MAFDIREEDEDRHYNDEFEEYEDVKQPQRPKFYRRKKFWMFCIPNAIIAIIIAVVLALYVIMPKIAQGLMNKSVISLTQIDITNPSPSGMDIVMAGDMEKTGPFHAEITFPGLVTVLWNDKELGTTEIPGTSTASGGSGKLNVESKFVITNEAAFTEFSSYMLNAQNFEWQLVGKLNVKALGHTVKDLDLNKKIQVNAFNGLSGIKIKSFSLPGDDPTGKGILLEIETTVTNPSAIQMYMGSLTLAISYKDVLMGYVSSTGLTMVRGEQTLAMKGVLIPQTTPEGLATTSEMMSRYCSNLATDTIATGFDVKPDGSTSLGWLAAAVKNLKLTVPLQSPTPLQLIKALNLGALGLNFTPQTAYQPVTTSTGVVANYGLPDGFNFKINFNQVSNAFTLSRNGVTIANLNSSYNPSTSDMAAGTLTFNLLQTPLVVPDASHQPFQEFNRDLTTGSNLPFQVTGFASVYANTSIGTVNLVNIPFNATTELSGLQSLANPAPTITALQVIAGSPTALTMAITVVIVNPSSISLSAGDVVLDLIYKGVRLGTVTMPNLAIVPGANTVQASSTIDPRTTPEGLELLNLYTSGAGASVSIVGTPTSTAVESLSLAFGALNIGSQMPGLTTKLLAGASLIVLDTTLVNGLAQTVVTVNNPFEPPMSIVSIDTKITYNGVALGSVVASFATPPVIPGVGQGTITAGLAMNTNPHDLVTLIRAQAIKNGLDTTAFDGLLSLQAGGNPPSSIFDGFNVADFTVKAMAGLIVDITMTTTVRIGDYELTMPYTQTGVPTATDQTILKLIPIVGTPIAQILVERSTLAFDAIRILSPGETSFSTDINGLIGDTGPLDAQIVFTNPVTVSFQGKALGSMAMPTVNAIANKGAVLNLTNVPFTITDGAAYSDFTAYALTNAKFDWTITATGLVVNAMGSSLPGVTMTKTVSLDGFNSLAGLKLTAYNITDIDAAGMHLQIMAELYNPSTIGMTIPKSIFNTEAHGKVLGPAVATDLTLAPHSPSPFILDATIAAGNGDLTPYLTMIFQNALSGVPTPLDAQGVGAPGVSWLDNAIKKLRLSTSLPPLPYDPIESVVIDAMSMDFACSTCDWAPTAGSSITAKTNLPFAKGAPIVKLKQDINVLDSAGNRIGRLVTDFEDAVSKGAYVSTSTTPGPLKIYDDARPSRYSEFIASLTSAKTYSLGLDGTADSVLNLGALGNITVKGIKLNVKTELAGLQGLNDIKYLQTLNFDGLFMTSATVLVQINNPSKLTLNIGDLALNLGVDFTDAGHGGKSTIDKLQLVPGPNEVVAFSQFDPQSHGGKQILDAISVRDVGIYLKPFIGSSKNPALDVGLQGLRQMFVAPQYMINNATVKVFARDWYLKVPDSTVEDGIAYVTVAGGNPFFGQTMNVLSANSEGQSTSAFTLLDKIGGSVNFLEFGMPGNYVLKGNETRDLVLPVKINPGGVLPFLLKQVPDLVALANTTGVLKFKYVYYPMVQVGSYKPVNQDYGSAMLYGDMFGVGDPDPALNMHVGPDFVNVLKHLQKLAAPVPPPAVNTTIPATSPVTVVPSPSLTSVPVVPSPSPTSVPVIPTTEPVPPTTEPVSPTTVPVPPTTTTVNVIPTAAPSPTPVTSSL